MNQAKADDKWMFDNLPHVVGKKREFGVVVDCPFCSGKHYHGKERGGRMADCPDGKNYYMIPKKEKR